MVHLAMLSTRWTAKAFKPTLYCGDRLMMHGVTWDNCRGTHHHSQSMPISTMSNCHLVFIRIRKCTQKALRNLILDILRSIPMSCMDLMWTLCRDHRGCNEV